MVELFLLLLSVVVCSAMDLAPVPDLSERSLKRKITEVIVKEEGPTLVLGDKALRRLEPYFVKQSWNWQQLYDKQCTSNPHPGGCSKTLTRWFFYPTFAKCYAFVYGGCGGTRNRFVSEKQCLKTCVPRQLPLRPPPIPKEVTLAPPPDSAELTGLLERHDNASVAQVQKLAEPVTKPPTTTIPPTEPTTTTTTTSTSRPDETTQTSGAPGDGTNETATTKSSKKRSSKASRTTNEEPAKGKTKRASNSDALDDSFDALEIEEFDFPEFAHMGRIIL